MIKAITEGYVIQIYDERGNCLGQRFHVTDGTNYEDEEGNFVDVDDIFTDENYPSFPYELVQPASSLTKKELEKVEELLDDSLLDREKF